MLLFQIQLSGHQIALLRALQAQEEWKLSNKELYEMGHAERYEAFGFNDRYWITTIRALESQGLISWHPSPTQNRSDRKYDAVARQRWEKSRERVHRLTEKARLILAVVEIELVETQKLLAQPQSKKKFLRRVK